MKIKRARLIYSKLQTENRIFPVLSDSNNYKLCASIMSLSRKYEVAIIDKTCRQCRECKVFSYRKFEAILKHNSLIASEDEPTRCFEAPIPKDHANMRGSNYFK